MIKKLLSSALFVSVVGIASSFAQATCTPDISCVPADSTFGICPDSTTGIATGTVGVSYNQQMSIKIPASTTQTQLGQTVTIPLTHLALTEVQVDTSTSGSPIWVDLSAIGLTYLGSGTNTPQGCSNCSMNGYTMTKYCYWDAPGSACVIVSGTPTKAGTFPIKIKSQGRANAGLTYLWAPAPENDDYKLVVSPVAGIEVLNTNKFDVMQNSPNPFNEKTVINFSSSNVSDVEFKVYNMVGAVVYAENLKADKGVNNITLKANSFAPGVYMYAVKNGNQTITKRMVVTQ